MVDRLRMAGRRATMALFFQRPMQASAFRLAAAGCASVLLLGVAAVHAQSSVYSWTDERGTLHFSNVGPPAGVATDVKRRVLPFRQGEPERARNKAVPFVTLEGDINRRFVPVVLEGGRKRREVLMLVDTGARTSLIDEELAGELDVEHLEDVRIVGVSGSPNGWLGTLRSLGVGGEKLRDPTVIVGPRPGVRLPGMDVLEALKLTIARDALARER